jgi:hypothetical protein
MTDEYQPLDKRIFGELKQRALARWISWHARNSGQDMLMTDSLKIMIDAWKSIDQANVLKSWKHLKEM